MSVKNEKTQEMLENEVLVNEGCSTELGTVTIEPKKSKIPAKAKKVLKVAAVAGLGTIVGYLLGSKSSRKNDYYDDSNVIDAELIIPDAE
jgi:hypothetical protein